MASKKKAKGAAKRAAPRKSSAPFTHIDRANGTFLREADLNKDKPHISPVSGGATVEKLTEAEAEAANA